MFTQEQTARIRETVFGITDCCWQGEIDVAQGTGLTVRVADGRASIQAESLTALARAFFRMAQELDAGRESFELHEEKRFDACGAFLDFSRNGVMTVESCKQYINYIAALGMNLLVLYTEDTFEVPEYPYMGYMRGRYTHEELREIDDYAVSMGVELVPCIQTLGHLGNMLQWPANAPLRDQPAVLMCDDEQVDAFLEAEIRAMRESVSGKRIHIGMDEAHGVGLGRYYLRHGAVDRFELLSRHLDKVVKLCRKYGFEPMMWSDMFFRLGSKKNEYYDKEANIPQSVIDALPDVGLVYWDYYHEDESWYEHMLIQHEKMSANTIFAGGVWTWSGFLPQVELTYETMEPGLRVCARHQVKTVMATMWGDNGQETNHFLALNQLPIFSESCWRPEEADRETVMATGEFLSGLPREAYHAFSLFYPGPVDKRPGKQTVWCDVLYPLGPQGEELQQMIARSDKALEILGKYQDDLRCSYAYALFDVCAKKGRLMQKVRDLYAAKDREGMKQAAQEDISALTEAYRFLREEHRAMWEHDYKRNGWEVIALRYGGVMGRLEDAQYALLRWCEGELDSLCELEEKALPNDRMYGAAFYKVCVSPTCEL
ncbi:MAG: family 20 glycosylhydrolase [Clostridia bacterium]|nr:family 20 glycosylhydrolase [Clostridia bacterium]